jgi:hypothetical protein
LGKHKLIKATNQQSAHAVVCPTPKVNLKHSIPLRIVPKIIVDQSVDPVGVVQF